MSLRGTVVVAVGSGLAASLGRKGTESDVTLYNHKQGDTVLSIVEASSYPEKIQSLISAVNIADQIILKVDAVDATLAEVIVAVDAIGMLTGHIIIGPEITFDEIQPLIKDTCMTKYPLVSEQVATLRETLSNRNLAQEGEAVVQVDHCFPVKGVGTVALGVVKQGTLRKYDNTTIYPEKSETVIKSIQVNDIGVSEAPSGVRVGLALKDVKPEQVVRGSILSTRRDIATEKVFEAQARLSSYAPAPLEEGDSFMVNSNLNYTPATLTSGSIPPGETSKVTIELEKKIPVVGDCLLIFDPGIKMPRAFGSLKTL